MHMCRVVLDCGTHMTKVDKKGVSVVSGGDKDWVTPKRCVYQQQPVVVVMKIVVVVVAGCPNHLNLFCNCIQEIFLFPRSILCKRSRKSTFIWAPSAGTTELCTNFFNAQIKCFGEKRCDG